jgi:hypothetical protein
MVFLDTPANLAFWHHARHAVAVAEIDAAFDAAEAAAVATRQASDAAAMERPAAEDREAGAQAAKAAYLGHRKYIEIVRCGAMRRACAAHDAAA